MYFDFDYYRQLLAHVWSLRQWQGRNRMLFRLLILVPLESGFHAVFMLLDYVFFPRLLSMEVRAPVFIVGHARSGTTLMHRLMSADGDRFSYFLYWETFFPSLLQKKIVRGLGWIDQHWLGNRIHTRLKKWDDETFGPYRHMHDMSLWNAEEDQFVMKSAFVTQQWALDIPIMDKLDIFHLDQMPAKRSRWMKHYRECIKRQLLLYGQHKIHLAKNPLMSGWVASLIETFPDARIVVMMRNPAECVPSNLKLCESTWKGKGWTQDQYGASLDELANISIESFHNPKVALAANPQTPQCVVDYRKLTAEPRSTVQAVYQALGMEVSEVFNDWLVGQEQQARSHKTSHSYNIDDYDISLERIERELTEFYDQYGWPRAAGAVGAVGSGI
jgi:hypothetical protein